MRDVQIVGLQPKDGSQIPGIRRWPEAYLPCIFDRKLVDEVIDIDQSDAERTMRAMAENEGVFCGVSSGGQYGALQLAERIEHAIIVAIICDRGDRYLSTGVFLPMSPRRSRRRKLPLEPIEVNVESLSHEERSCPYRWQSGYSLRALWRVKRCWPDTSSRARNSMY